MNSFDCSIRPFLNLFHSWLYQSHLSRFFGDDLVFFLPSGFQLIIIFGNRNGTWKSKGVTRPFKTAQYNISELLLKMNISSMYQSHFYMLPCYKSIFYIWWLSVWSRNSSFSTKPEITLLVHKNKHRSWASSVKSIQSPRSACFCPNAH
jgi:hypothetical protein